MCENKNEYGRGAKVIMGFESIELLNQPTIINAWNQSKLTSLNTTGSVNEVTVNEISIADTVFGEKLESEY